MKKQTTADISHMIYLLLTAFQPQCKAYTQIGLKNPAGAMWTTTIYYASTNAATS